MIYLDFLTYLVAAIQTVAAHVGDGVLGMSYNPHSHSPTDLNLTKVFIRLPPWRDPFWCSFWTITT